MTAAEVRDKVRAWVAGVIGIQTIHGNQNAPAPAEPYGALWRTMSDTVHDDPAGEDFVIAGDELRQAPLIETYWRFALDVFGPDAEDYLQKIVTASNVPTAMWPLRPLVLAETSRITTNFELRDQELKDRAQMTIEVRGIVRDGLVVDTIAEQTPELVSVD